MAKNNQLTIAKRSAVVTLRNEGYSYRVIANKLGISYKGVQSTIKRYTETGSLEDRPRIGRPRATSKVEDRHIITMSKRNRRLTAPQLRAELNKSREKEVSVSTVKLRLKEGELHGRIAVRKPLLRKQNRVKRLQWARLHQHWTEEDWSKVLWSDESKFEVFGSKRRIFVRRSKTEKMLPACVVPTVKHGGGSVMVWGCFSLAGTGDLVKIDGIMKKEHYRDILEHHAVRSGLKIIGHNFIFQQDNDPKHNSKLCRGYLEDLERSGVLRNMSWPAQSPDLNPIELLWEEVDRRIRVVCPTSENHLWTIIQNAWNNISIAVIEKLISRMPRLCAAVIKAKGNFFDEKDI